MIENFIKEYPNTNAWHTSFRVLEALEGEKILSVLELDDISWLIVLESGFSLLLYRNGAFSLESKDLTIAHIEAFAGETETLAHSHVKAMKLIKKPEAPDGGKLK